MTILHIIFTCCLSWSYSFIIISYPDLDNEYLDLYASHYELMNRSDDEDRLQLSKLCTELAMSNAYKMLDVNAPRRPTEYASKTDHLKAQPNTLYENVRCQSFQTHFRRAKNAIKSVNLCPCPKQINSQYWFVGFGHTADIKYLFIQADSASPVHFEALIEPSSKFDRVISFAASYLEKNFVNIMNQRSKWKISITQDDPLLALNCNQLFRLCSSVYEAVGNKETLAVKTFYIKHYVPSKRLLDLEVIVDEIRKSPGKYPRNEIRVNLVACSHGIGDLNHPYVFYLTQDPSERNAVFVLETDGNSMDLKIKSRVQNIPILEETFKNI